MNQEVLIVPFTSDPTLLETKHFQCSYEVKEPFLFDDLTLRSLSPVIPGTFFLKKQSLTVILYSLGT